MIVYSDLDALKTAAEEKKNKLIEEDKILKKQKQYSKKVYTSHTNKFELL